MESRKEWSAGEESDASEETDSSSAGGCVVDPASASWAVGADVSEDVEVMETVERES